jgi:SulP family sulfate permease
MPSPRWFSFLRWPRPTPELLRADLIAGVTVGLVMVPQAVAYAGLAQMPLVTGLYASLIPALLAVMFGSSNRISVGPAALTCVLISASLYGLAEPGGTEWVNLAVWLAWLSGLLQLGLGLGGYGWLLNLISAPVLMGFTQAAALLIMGSQVPALLGLSQVDWTSPATLSPMLWGQPALWGGVCLGLLLFMRHWRPRWPSIMVMVIAAAGLSYTTGYADVGTVVGALPSGLPALYWPTWPGWETLTKLLVPAMVIALVSFLETASSARIESQRDGKRWDDNLDLVGQGVAKLASGLFGSFATSTSFSRSALMLYAGGRSAWAVVWMVLFVLLALLLLMPVLQHVPRAVLAAVVITAVSSLFQPRQFRTLWWVSRAEAITAGLTFVITLLTSPTIYWGVLAGVLITLAHFLHHRLHPRIIEIGLHPDGSLRDRHLWNLQPLAPRLYALRMDAELDFAAASPLERNIHDHLSAHPGVKHLMIFALPINRIDATGVEMFSKLETLCRERGITLHISGLKLPIERVLRQAGCLQPGDHLQMYRTDAEALNHCAQVLKP